MPSTLVEKYRPKTLDEFIGQTGKIEDMRHWADSWDKGRPSSKSMFLYGSPGTGKTSACYAIANEFNWNVLEINASEERKVEQIKEKLSHAVYFHPFSGKTLILVDEVDYVRKRGLAQLEDLIKASVNPVVLTCNNRYAVRMLSPYFEQESLLINFSKIQKNTLRDRLVEIAQKEGIKIPNIDKLILASNGDIRYAINNMEIEEVTHKGITGNYYDALHDIFSGSWDGDTSNIDLEFLWKIAKYNMPNFYDTIYNKNVYEFIADTDIIMDHVYKEFRGKANFKYWSYIISILKRMPTHQKSARIEIPKSFGGYKPLELNPAYPKYLHMSSKKTSKMLLSYPKLLKYLDYSIRKPTKDNLNVNKNLENTANKPQDDIKKPKEIKQPKTLFDF
jgi:DNA polymerase III delta prime subunit